jgi:hypothetical protein
MTFPEKTFNVQRAYESGVEDLAQHHVDYAASMELRTPRVPLEALARNTPRIKTAAVRTPRFRTPRTALHRQTPPEFIMAVGSSASPAQRTPRGVDKWTRPITAPTHILQLTEPLKMRNYMVETS